MSMKSRISNWLQINKDSAVSRLIALNRLGSASWTNPREYKEFSEEGYKNCVIVFKAINELMQCTGNLPFTVYQVSKNGDKKEDSESDLAKLLRRPNPKQGQAAFIGSLTGYYNISGNGWLEMVEGARGQPFELYSHRPDRFKVNTGEFGITHHTYTNGGQSKDFPVEDDLIRHFKTFNPLDDWYGLSPLRAAAFDIDIHTSTLEWNKALLDNRAQPSGALMYQPKTGEAYLPDKEYNRLKDELESQTGKAGGNGKPMLLEGGLVWQQMSLSPADMDYLNSKHATARDICIALGVPPQILSIPGDSTYNNMAEARLSFYENKILPWGYMICEELNAWLAPRFGDQYRIGIDEDKISALSPRRELVWKNMNIANWLTPDEKRKATGYEEKGGEAEKIRVAASDIPIDSVLFTNDGLTDDSSGKE